MCVSVHVLMVCSIKQYNTNSTVFFRGVGGMGCLLELSCLSVHEFMVCSNKKIILAVISIALYPTGKGEHIALYKINKKCGQLKPKI